MDHVEGFAGASAGAITAFLLSIGYNRARLESFLDETDFNSFFDSPVQRSRPIVGGCEPVDDTDQEKELIAALGRLPTGIDLAQWLLSGFAMVSGGGLLLAALLWRIRSEIEQMPKQILKEKVSKPPFSLLLQYWPQYIAYMGRDMGVFAGCAARRLFDELISAQVPSGGTPPFRNITFDEHEKVFKKKLLVTGTNLTLGRTQLFSAEETPNFPVADAIRISMSLPFFYKPYVIRTQRKGWPPCGTYVDGGLWNNMPFREFDSTPPADQKAPASATTQSTAKGKPATLGLRLEITPSVEVLDFGQLLVRVGQFGLFGTGETQVLSKYLNQMILLDTRGLDLIDFHPPKPDRDRAVKRARRATWRYFGMEVPEADLDPEDDAKTKFVFDSDRPCG
jgi:predicted acylesterase/phospholipase RssA